MKDILLFGNFKSGPARPLLDKLGLHEIVEVASTWDDFRKSVQNYDSANNGVVLYRAHQLLQGLGAVNHALLVSIIFAMGFQDCIVLGDDKRFLAGISIANGYERDAIAACIAAGCGR